MPDRSRWAAHPSPRPTARSAAGAAQPARLRPHRASGCVDPQRRRPGTAVLHRSVYARALSNDALHAFVHHLHMFLAGCLLSWTIVGVDRMPRRRSHSVRVAVLVVVAAAHDTLSKYLHAHALRPDPALCSTGTSAPS
jgi:Cytochrome c oxidase caa3 assembly factor (Caa3_CtaG)